MPACAAACVRGNPEPSGGSLKCIIGSATPQNTRPTPMPPEKIIASQLG